MTPKEVIDMGEAAFNVGDAKNLALHLVHSINHQDNRDPVKGNAAIQAVFAAKFEQAAITGLAENPFEDQPWATLEWKDPLDYREWGLFKVSGGKIAFQQGYRDRLPFLRRRHLPLPVR